MAEVPWKMKPLSVDEFSSMERMADSGDINAILRLVIHYSMYDKGSTNEVYWIRRGAALGDEDFVYMENRIKYAAETCGIKWSEVDRITPEMYNVLDGE